MRRRALLAAALGTSATFPAAAAETPGSGMSDDERRSPRFPQPVRVGDLADRYLLQPEEAQRVLGRVDRIVRDPKGELLMVVRRGGLLGFGTVPVAIRLGEVALLGEHVTLIGMPPPMLDALPRFDGAGTSALPPGEVIRMSIVGPFH